MPKIEDCVADDAVWSEPLSPSEFPAIREKYRESGVFEADLGVGSAQKHVTSLRFLGEFPRDRNRES
jgi:hypothetical protein